MQTNPQIRPEEAQAPGAAEDRAAPAPESAATAAPSAATESVPAGAAALRRDWIRSLAVFAACSALLLWAFRDEISTAIEVWSRSRTYGHAFFIFPIVLFLFYRQRRRLAALQPEAAPWALVPIAGLVLLWAIGDLANLMVVQQFAFVGLWQALFVLVFGWRVAKASLFALAYLYLAVPFGSSVIPFLQDVTAHMAVHLLRLSGIPVFLDGYYIQIPSGSFLVAQACSGVRYLIVCIALGILAAHLFFRSWPRRILFVGLSMVVPIIANGVRAYGIIMLAHLSDFTIAVSVDHVVYGFLFLSVVTLTLLGLGALLRDRYDGHASEPLASAPEGGGGPRPAALGLPGQVLGGGLALGVVLLAQAWTTSAMAPPDTTDLTLVPPALPAPWMSVADEAPAWTPEFHGTDVNLVQSYRRGTQQVNLHIGYYAYQREGAEAISDLNILAGERSGWKILNFRQARLKIDGRFHAINKLMIVHDDQTYLVWYWYWIGGADTNSRMIGKLLELKALATGGEHAAAIVAIGAKVSEDAEQTDALLDVFLRQSLTGNDNLVQAGKLPAGTGSPAAKSGLTEGARKP